HLSPVVVLSLEEIEYDNKIWFNGMLHEITKLSKDPSEETNQKITVIYQDLKDFFTKHLRTQFKYRYGKPLLVSRVEYPDAPSESDEETGPTHATLILRK